MAAIRSLGDGVSWTPLYLGFLAYIFVIVTYQVRIADVAMGVALFGLATSRRQTRMPLPIKLLAMFLLWAAVTAPFSIDMTATTDALLDHAKLWLIMLVAINALYSTGNIRTFLVLFTVFYAFYPLRGGVVTYLVGGAIQGRTQWVAIYMNPNDLAALTLPPIGVCIGLLFTEPRRSPIWYWAAALIAPLTVLVLLTKSRAVFIGLSVMVLILIRGMRRGRTRTRAVTMVAIVGTIALMVAPNGVLDRMGGLVSATKAGDARHADGSSEERYSIWQTSWRIIADHPITGVGLANYPEANFEYSPHIGRRDAHSTYFKLAAENGIPGAVLWVSAVVSALVYASGIRRRLRHLMPRECEQLRAMEASVIGFLVACVWGSYAELSFPLIHLAAIWAMSDLLRRRAEAAGYRIGAAPAHRPAT